MIISALYATPIVRPYIYTHYHIKSNGPNRLQFSSASSLDIISMTGLWNEVSVRTAVSTKPNPVSGLFFSTLCPHLHSDAVLFIRACYLGIPLYICGFLVIGASFQNHLPLAAIIMGWGIAEFSIMIMTVVVYAYLNDCFPRNQVGRIRLWD